MPEIYALVDPRDGRIRYIGKANDSQKRLSTHLRDSRRRNTPVYAWIRKLQVSGLKPSVRVLSVVSHSDWQEEEKRLIALHRSELKLLNIADGGDQPHCCRETCQKNARRLNENLSKNPRALRIRELKRLIMAAAKRGSLKEKTRVTLRGLGHRRPDLFGCFTQL